MKKFDSMQDYFNQTVAYMLTQKNRCVNEKNYCVYLNDEGNKCAIGYWIPKDHEALGCEEAISTLFAEYPELSGVAWPKGEYGLDLAESLQYLHDEERYRVFHDKGSEFSEEGTRKVGQICKTFNLKNPLETI